MKVAIAGSSGFVGKRLIERLKQDSRFQITPLARSIEPACDLFSLLDVERALEGQDQAIYLVHSMSPSSQLSQGSFADYDLILADNFARACKKNKIQRILYLGGIVPLQGERDPEELSLHLRSRLEVEEIFRSYGIPTLALRAGMVLGAGGSSFQLLINLVCRLPAMVCPAWTRKKTSPIHVDDVAESFYYALCHLELTGARDLEGPESLTYLAMLRAAAVRLHKHRLFLDVPFFSPALSKLWVRVVTGAPKNLVYPLIDSLTHDMRPNPEHVLRLPNWNYKTFSDSLEEVAQEAEQGHESPKPKAFTDAHLNRLHVVQSVQRHRLPAGKNAVWASEEYVRWLNSMLGGIIKVVTDGSISRFTVAGTNLVLLELTLSKDRSDENRMLFYITGGKLDAGSKRGRLEFRTTPDGKYLITAIHDFKPRLPWYLYKFSQALIHESVMTRFGEYLNTV